MTKYVGIDIGGTSVKYGLVDADGTVSNKDSFKTNDTDKEALLNDLVAAVKKIQAIDEEVSGIGVSMPGVVQEDGFLSFTSPAASKNSPVTLMSTLTQPLSIF